MMTRAPEVIPFSNMPGAEILGMDVSRPLEPDEAELVKNTVARYGVIVFRRQRLEDEAQQVAFARSLGETVIPWLHADEPNTYARIRELTPRPAYSGAHPSCVYFVNGPGYCDNADNDFAQGWHGDLTYLQTPLDYSCLYALEAPDQGYETWFADQSAAYERLDAATRQRVDQLHIYHDFKAAFPQLAPVVHPVALTHPRTGRKALYGIPGFAAPFPVNTPPDEGKSLMEKLTAHLQDPALVYRHKWATGDLVLWDNRCVVHRRGPQIEGQTRILRRVPAGDGDAKGLRQRLRFG